MLVGKNVAIEDLENSLADLVLSLNEKIVEIDKLKRKEMYTNQQRI